MVIVRLRSQIQLALGEKEIDPEIDKYVKWTLTHSTKSQLEFLEVLPYEIDQSTLDMIKGELEELIVIYYGRRNRLSVKTLQVYIQTTSIFSRETARKRLLKAIKSKGDLQDVTRVFIEHGQATDTDATNNLTIDYCIKAIKTELESEREPSKQVYKMFMIHQQYLNCIRGNKGMDVLKTKIGNPLTAYVRDKSRQIYQITHCPIKVFAECSDHFEKQNIENDVLNETIMWLIKENHMFAKQNRIELVLQMLQEDCTELNSR